MEFGLKLTLICNEMDKNTLMMRANKFEWYLVVALS